MKESILKNITQVLLIVFSVVLGLFLNERIEERKANKEASKLLATIKSEVRENKKLMESWVPYHQEILESWDRLYSDEKFLQDFVEDHTVLYSEVFTKSSILGRTPTHDAWDIAKSHPLMVNINYDELLILSKLYNQQGIAFDPMEDIITLNRSPDFNSEEKAVENLKLFKNLMEDLLALELQLMYYYNQADEILDL